MKISDLQEKNSGWYPILSFKEEEADNFTTILFDETEQPKDIFKWYSVTLFYKSGQPHIIVQWFDKNDCAIDIIMRAEPKLIELVLKKLSGVNA